MRAEGRQTFEEWARARQQHLVRSAYLLTGDFQRAEDLVQEALVKAAVRWDRLRDGNPDAWVRTVVYREHVSWWRRRRREVLVDNVPEVLTHDTPTLTDRDLVAALARLTWSQRAVLLLRFAEDLGVAETAEVLGVTDGTVKRQTSVALARLRELGPGLDPGSRDLVEER
jgi:RNA polymerase sigma-70 factor (sigma-E family)